MPTENAAEIWTTKEIISTVIATGAISAFISTFLGLAVSWYQGRLTKHAEATYLALRTSVALEKYAIECYDKISQANGAHKAHGDNPRVRIPADLTLPSDGDWKTMPTDLTAEIFSFLNEVDIQTSYARYSADWEQNPYHSEDVAKELGATAWTLAANIRSRLQLPAQTKQKEKIAELFPKS